MATAYALSGTIRTITSEHQYSKLSRYSSPDFAEDWTSTTEGTRKSG